MAIILINTDNINTDNKILWSFQQPKIALYTRNGVVCQIYLLFYVCLLSAGKYGRVST